jgi:G3E family GTPase
VVGRTPLTLITGSLGSGKTTLLKRILEQADTAVARLAIIMNEFGEIAIDGRVIQGENIQIVELAGGCVCCSMTGEFEAAVREVLEKIHPEWIVVEATGVAEADALVYEVEDNLPEIRLDSVVSIIDAYLSIRYPHVGYTTRTQIESADIMLINKIDLITDEEISQVEAQVRQYNESAVMLRTVKCDFDTRLLFGPDIEKKRPVALVPHGKSQFQSFTYTTDAFVNEAKFRQLAAGLPPSVIRAKGFVRFEEGGRLFNYVAGRFDLEPFPAEQTQLVFIGRDLEKDWALILRQLRDCELRNALPVS